MARTFTADLDTINDAMGRLLTDLGLGRPDAPEEDSDLLDNMTWAVFETLRSRRNDADA